MQPELKISSTAKHVVLLLLMILAYSGVYSQFPNQHDFENKFKSFDLTDVVINLKVYDDSMVKGSTDLYYARGNRHERYIVRGKYEKEDSTIHFDVFQETAAISATFGTFQNYMMGNYKMKLTNVESKATLQKKKVEEWNADFNGFPATVTLETKKPKRKINIPVETKEDKNLERNYHIEKSIAVGEYDVVKIEILDNARIDNDIVSVYLNDSLLIHMQKISDIPFEFYVTLDKSNPTTLIKLAAESYGSMPPCTASMIVTAGDNTYTFDLNSTYDSNAAFELTLK